MTSTTLLKEYDLKKLQDLCKDYKFLAIQGMQGEKIQPFNQQKVSIKDQFQKCVKRLNSEAVPDGYYYFCFANSPRQSNHPDKFIFRKGNPIQDTLRDRGIIRVESGYPANKNDLLSLNSALEYITQIAELKTEVSRLNMENKALIDEIDVLKAELAEAEKSELENGLSEKPLTHISEFLKDQAPTVISALDRWFDIQEKKLDLDKQRFSNPGSFKSNGSARPKIKIKKFEPGSPDHLNLIRNLYKEDKEDRMNNELDLLQIHDPEAYKNILTELNLTEEEEDEN